MISAASVACQAPSPWRIAAWLTHSSSPARVKLRWRAEASKARRALSGSCGREDMIFPDGWRDITSFAEARRAPHLRASQGGMRMLQRRQFLAGTACLVAASSGGGLAAPAAVYGGSRLRDAGAALEIRSGGRLGVAVLDTGGWRRFGWRADERFPFCSTFKFLLVAAILARVDRGAERLDRRLPVRSGTLLGNSPFTQSRAGGDAMVEQLCRASVSLSDNEAANML